MDMPQPGTWPPVQNGKQKRGGLLSTGLYDLLQAALTKLNGIAASRSHVEAYQSANISRSSGTWYDLVCDFKPRDVNSEFSGATFVSSHGGTFLVMAGAMLVNPPDQYRLTMRVTDASGTVEYIRTADATKSGPTTAPTADLMVAMCVPIYFAGAGGKLKVQYLQSNAAAAAATVRGGPEFCWVRIREIP